MQGSGQSIVWPISIVAFKKSWRNRRAEGCNVRSKDARIERRMQTVKQMAHWAHWLHHNGLTNEIRTKSEQKCEPKRATPSKLVRRVLAGKGRWNLRHHAVYSSHMRDPDGGLEAAGGKQVDAEMLSQSAGNRGCPQEAKPSRQPVVRQRTQRRRKG